MCQLLHTTKTTCKKCTVALSHEARVLRLAFITVFMDPRNIEVIQCVQRSKRLLLGWPHLSDYYDHSDGWNLDPRWIMFIFIVLQGVYRCFLCILNVSARSWARLVPMGMPMVFSKWSLKRPQKCCHHANHLPSPFNQDTEQDT